MKHIYFLFGCFLFLGWNSLSAQFDSPVFPNLELNADFLFRVEQDWSSRLQDGSYRDDRSRMRYKLRAGFTYRLNTSTTFGASVRTGNIYDHQGAPITLGSNPGEFGTIQLGFEKLYLKLRKNQFSGTFGKFDFPFAFQNDMFWSGDVNPEGIAGSFSQSFDSSRGIDSLRATVGHFIVKSNGRGFNSDQYFQGIQLYTQSLNKRLEFFPGYFYFNELDNIPDGKGSYTLPYSILHLGILLKPIDVLPLRLGFDYYQNTENYAQNDSIPNYLQKEKTGWVLSLSYGNIGKNKKWSTKLIYAKIQKYAVVDCFAQNNWTPWDYSSYGAIGTRISNFKGIEIRIRYTVNPKFNILFRSYFVDQLVTEGEQPEANKRARLDLNIKI